MFGAAWHRQNGHHIRSFERRHGSCNVSAETRVIYKYHNRRLYDTTARRYTTLEDIRRLVLDAEDFVVRDKQTQADITFITLLNVLALAHAARPAPLLDPEFLLTAIRAHGRPPAELGAHDEPPATEYHYAAQPYSGT
jgi:polyhydroxyalkanoate synthesis repressor PhaR